MNEPIHIISLGAGVQSSTMALMAAHGEIEPMPKAAVFADTQDEPQSVYRWLGWLEGELPFPVHRVTDGKLSDEALRSRVSKTGDNYTRTVIPLYVENGDGTVGKIGFRTCTLDYKLKPLMKAARKIGGIARGQQTVGVIQWVGISMDEITRCKPSKDAWAEVRWPLIEKRMSRHLCLEWMQSNGYPTPPRSACKYCPFHDSSEWRRMQLEEPEEFAEAVKFERELQASKAATDNFDGVPYLHRSCKPLDQIDFRSDVEHGQKLLPGWQDECEGMCGI